jgi:hypothetical protein
MLRWLKAHFALLAWLRLQSTGQSGLPPARIAKSFFLPFTFALNVQPPQGAYCEQVRYCYHLAQADDITARALCWALVALESAGSARALLAHSTNFQTCFFARRRCSHHQC